MVYLHSTSIWKAEMGQSRGCSPPTNMARVRFWPSARCGLSFLLVFALLQVSFSQGSLVFLPPQKQTLLGERICMKASYSVY